VRIGIKLRNIEPNIDELVLHGFLPGDRYRIGEVVEQELSQLFAERDLPSSLIDGGKIDHLDGGEFEAAQGSRPEAIGTQVAQAVYRGVKNDLQRKEEEYE
jgi:hypothetical protein